MKKEMLIALSTAAVLVLAGCGNEQKTQMSVSSEAPKAQTQTAATETAAVSNKSEVVKEAVAPVQERVQKAHEEAKQAVEKIEKKVTGAVEEAKQKVATAADEAKQAAPKADGATLFTKCAGCHGAKGEKHALGKSNIIAGQSKADLMKKIHGYQTGSYGGAMKGLMASQVKGLNDAEIDALADYISKL